MWWLDMIAAFALPPMSSYGWHLLLRLSRYAFLGGWLGGAVAGVIIGSIQPDWAWVSGSAASGLTALALWWYRRRRKRAPRAYGAKSRALVAALVRKAREAAKPRPVLRPVPGSVP